MTTAEGVALVAIAAAGVGLFVTALQLGCLLRHLRTPALLPRAMPGISVLKPLCGLDDGLEESLRQFAALTYPRFELLLGVKDVHDAAYPLACRLEAEFPNRVRVVVQRGSPGLNPKVNQLLTLSREARHDLFVISDSNVRVPPLYLHELARHFEDAAVGCVTHLVSGVGEARAGSAMDNLYLSSVVSPGMVGSLQLLGVPVVVGKSMALRRSDLARLGGFAAFQDLLAEDYFIGLRVASLGKRVVIARQPILNVSMDKPVSAFFARFVRWSTMQRNAVGPSGYASLALLNPLPWALGAFLVSPRRETLLALVVTAGVKTALDAVAARRVRGTRVALRDLWLLPAKDLVVFVAWCVGLVRDDVVWRGNRLWVHPGTRLSAIPEVGSPRWTPFPSSNPTPSSRSRVPGASRRSRGPAR